MEGGSEEGADQPSLTEGESDSSDEEDPSDDVGHGHGKPGGACRSVQ